MKAEIDPQLKSLMTKFFVIVILVSFVINELLFAIMRYDSRNEQQRLQSWDERITFLEKRIDDRLKPQNKEKGD